ncbi:3'-5' exonuclease [Haloferula sargassicola]|uniref:DNA polymerase III PolC-type n=1 Tax=Haloferula sargassicola TaxID=490096 RepID=A0ABP9UUV6_9BACT
MKLTWFQRPDPRVAAHLAPPKFARSTPLAEIPFVVLDAETTGLRVGFDKLLSVAAMPVRRERAEVDGLRSWLVRREDLDVTPATSVHTILPSDSTGGTPEDEVLAGLSEMLAGRVIVGHHVGFDAGVLDHALRRHFHARLRHPLVDTARLAMQVLDAYRPSGYAGQRPPGLDEVCAHLGLGIWERHTADGDTFAIAQLFLLLCARLRRKLGRDPVFGDLPVARA